MDALSTGSPDDRQVIRFDCDSSLFETFATISAEQASTPISARL